MFKYNYNFAKGIDTKSANIGNQITQSYYWHLVGEINRGTALKAVCRIEHIPTSTFTYHLISY